MIILHECNQQYIYNLIDYIKIQNVKIKMSIEAVSKSKC